MGAGRRRGGQRLDHLGQRVGEGVFSWKENRRADGRHCTAGGGAGRGAGQFNVNIMICNLSCYVSHINGRCSYSVHWW